MIALLCHHIIFVVVVSSTIDWPSEGRTRDGQTVLRAHVQVLEIVEELKTCNLSVFCDDLYK